MKWSYFIELGNQIDLTQSLYRSRAGRHFYGTENVISAGLGPVGNTEKKFGPIMSNF